MTRHLKGCSAIHEPSQGKPAARLFHPRVEDAYFPIFWLDLEMKAQATLAESDSFLREIWLEWCGYEIAPVSVSAPGNSRATVVAILGGI
jgi:hypothetical protein